MTPGTKEATKEKKPTAKELEEARLQKLANDTNALIDSVIELEAHQTHVTDKSIGVVRSKLRDAIAMARALKKD